MSENNGKRKHSEAPPFKVSVRFVSLPDSEKRLARAYDLLLQKVRKLEAKEDDESNNMV